MNDVSHKGIICLPPGGGRRYEMGRLTALFKADGSKRMKRIPPRNGFWTRASQASVLTSTREATRFSGSRGQSRVSSGRRLEILSGRQLPADSRWRRAQFPQLRAASGAPVQHVCRCRVRTQHARHRRLVCSARRRGVTVSAWLESFSDDGQKHGLRLRYHPNGRLMYEGNYQNGKKVGL